jgi:hypothetical protein
MKGLALVVTGNAGASPTYGQKNQKEQWKEKPKFLHPPKSIH